MNRNEKLLVGVSALYFIASTMSGVFVAVYLYSATGSLWMMSLYTMNRFGLYPLAFIIGAQLTRKIRMAGVLTSGLIVNIIGLAVLLSINTGFNDHNYLVFVIASIFGLGEGLYWFSMNILNQAASTKPSRGKFVAQMGIFNGVAMVLAPLLSTQIILFAPSDTTGYIWIFEVVIVIFSITAFISTKVSTLVQYEPLVFRDKLILKKGSQWRYVIISHFLFGIRDSLTLFLTGLLVYNAASGNGSMYGNLLTFFAILGILSNTVASRLIKRENRLKMYQRGAYLLFTSTVVLVFMPNIYGALYFGIANSIGSPFYFNPFSIIMMNALHDYSEKENINVRIILKETALAFGRLLGMGLIVVAFFTLPETIYLKVVVSFSSCFALILIYYATNYHIARDKRIHEHLQ